MPSNESAAPLLDARDVHIRYGAVEAVRGVSLAVREGQIATIIGANGAGKTTLLKALMGLLPAEGPIAYRGLEDRRPSVETLVRHRIALITEQRDLFGTMSVVDNLLLGGFDRWRCGARDHRAGLDDIYAMFPRLHERRRQKAATLSGGERQMLAMGRALMGKPRLLMLDEPTLGLAPLVAKDIFTAVADLRDRGVACLLVEQNARAALAIADYAYVMEQGRFVLEGTAADLAQDSRVIDSYLGIASVKREAVA